MKHIVLSLLVFGLAAGAVINAGADVKSPATEKEKLSYAIGVLFAGNMALEAEVDTEAFLQGVRDVLEKAELKLSPDEMQQVMQRYRDEQIKRRGEQAKQNSEAGTEFLANNSKKEGVIALPSGLQYKIIKQGGGVKPGLDDTVMVHYRGTLINGKEFDSSYRRGEPTKIELRRVIKGWQEAVTSMPVGSKWEIYVPSQLAYGEKQAGRDIQPNSALVFEIELLGIN